MDTILPILLYVLILPVLVTVVSFILLQKANKITANPSTLAFTLALNLGFYTAYFGHFGLQYDSLLWSLLAISMLTIIGLWRTDLRNFLGTFFVPLSIIFLMLWPYQVIWKKGILEMIKVNWIVDAAIFFAILWLVFQFLLQFLLGQLQNEVQKSSLADEVQKSSEDQAHLYILIALTLAALSMGFVTSSIAIVIGGSISLAQLSGAFGLVIASIGLWCLFQGNRLILESKSLFSIAFLAYLMLFSLLMNAHFYLSPELPKLFVVLILSMPLLSLKSYLWARSYWQALQNPYLAVVWVVVIAAIMSGGILGLEWHLEQLRLLEQGSGYPY
jgi:hypothetical protein